MTTVNYGWTLPTVGASVNAWGTLVNTILTDIDAKMVSKTDAQTLTNKTLAAPVITGGASISGNVSVTGTGAFSGTLYMPQNNLLQWNSTGAAGGTNRAVVWGDSSGNLNFGNGPSNATSATLDAAGNWIHQGSSGSASLATYTRCTATDTIHSSTNSSGSPKPFKWSVNAESSFEMILDVNGNLLPGANGTQAFGSTSMRWSQVWCTAGAFNTSDAILKTKVSKFNDAEIQAAVALSKEIGWFQWLDAVKEKGEEKARHHVGLTVQRAAEVLKSFGLDPWIYGFMSHDIWGDEITEHPAIEAKEALLDTDGNVIEEAVEAKEARSEVTLKAGESYAFRYDQLNLFISRGLEARLAALEARA